MRVPITLDLHLPNFNYPDTPPEQLFEKLIDISTTAESSGFSSVSLMDHLLQIFMVGPPENYMFDGNTMLAAIAARTSKLTLGTLVGAVTYRNPALLAKITTTLDIISGGRAWCGVGAAWFEEEHLAYGYEFPPLKTRFEYLEETLQILRAMFTEPQATFEGEHFRVEDAYNNPKPVRGDIPILIGGSGEKKTLRMVAQYGDGCNFFGGPDQVRHLIGVLEGHCERLGRDISEITKTVMGTVVIAPTMEGAQAKLEALKALGLPPERIPMITLGDPDTVGEAAMKLKDAGAEGMTVSLPDVHDLETLALVGQTLGPVFA
ncbi:MAG: LLM class F420-dependent oxidoreductase [Solirubrobacteraceae bacterium]